MADQVEIVQFPQDPVDGRGHDVALPLKGLLHALSMLGTRDDLEASDGAAALITGPAQSVAIIEAGATAATKAWSTALGAGISLTGITAAVTHFWSGEPDPVRVAAIGGTALVLATLGLAIAIIVSADVRGRAAGASVMIEARARVATTFLTLTRSGTGASKDPLVQQPNGTIQSNGTIQPSIVSIAPAMFSCHSSRWPGAKLTVEAVGIDAAGATWVYTVQQDREPRWIPQSDLASARV